MKIKRRSFLKGFVASCFLGAKVGRAAIEKDVKSKAKSKKKKVTIYPAKYYKVGEPIAVIHQAPTGSNVTAEIYLPGGYRDSFYPDIDFIELGGSGTYRGVFTPDMEGEWMVLIGDNTHQTIRKYAVIPKYVSDTNCKVLVRNGKPTKITRWS
jgi:hypothetical protein